MRSLAHPVRASAKRQRGRTTSAVLVIAIAATLGVPTATAAPTAAITTAIQASVEVDFTTPGDYFSANTLTQITTRSGGEVTTTTLIAAGITRFRCDDFGCSGESVQCVAEGTAPDGTPPPGLLEFGVLGSATLRGTFFCAPGLVGVPSTLMVDIQLTGTDKFVSAGPLHSPAPGPPDYTGGIAQQVFFGAAVTGTAGNGSIEYIRPNTTGTLVYSHYAFVSPDGSGL